MDESKLISLGKPLLVNAARMNEQKQADVLERHNKDQVIRYAMGAGGITLLVLVDKEQYIKEEDGSLSVSEQSLKVLHRLVGKLHDRLWPDHNHLTQALPDTLQGSLDVLAEQLKDPEARMFVKAALAKAEMSEMSERSSQYQM